MSKLFSTYKLRNIELKNRIVMPPMCTYSADEEGFVSEFHLIHYATRAIGGVSLIIMEATPVEECGRISNNDIGIWSDNHIAGLKRITNSIKLNGAIPGIQLGHAGRKCSANIVDTIYAPSSIAFSSDYKLPVEMTKDDIKRVVESFKQGARRAKEAGFEFLEIHGAHGYLISEFLSPLTNKRTDEYGGNYENRARILGEIIDSIREVYDGELCLRVSADDYCEGGNKAEHLVEIINLIKYKGIDVIDVSSGGVVDTSVSVYPGYQVKHAEIIKNGCDLPVIAGGLLINAVQMEEIISNNRADMVFVGRELLRNPYFALKSAYELKADIAWPTQYETATFR
jgi:NADPH2 dehydrogenase